MDTKLEVASRRSYLGSVLEKLVVTGNALRKNYDAFYLLISEKSRKKSVQLTSLMDSSAT